MRKEKRQVELHLSEMSSETIVCDSYGETVRNECTYVFKGDNFIDVDTLKHFVEVDVPETISEFRKMHDLSKDELLEWLKENYK